LLIADLIGHYRVVATLGSGGMGVVVKAIDTRLNRPVALKAIKDDSENTDAILRLRAEAMAAASLDHPYICKIYELLETASATHVVMEFVEGETLGDILERRQPSLAETLRYGSEVAEGLANAHARGILHRDVKPSNVMVTPHGHIKLLDFGIARSHDDSALTQTGLTLPGQVPGTPQYMAPEQALGLPMDGRADIFSLGVLLFKCLTGRLPFTGETRDAYMQEMLAGRRLAIGELAPSVPAPVREIVTACLERDPDKRPASALAVAQSLRRSSEVLATGSFPVEVAPSRGLPKWALQVSGLALVVLAIALVAYRWPSGGDGETVTRGLVPVVTWQSAESDARISPDGRWLSFISDKQDQSRLYVQAMEAGEPVVVAIQGTVQSHAWAPDGRELAVVVHQGEAYFLMIVPAFFGGTPRTSVPLPGVGKAIVVRWVGDDIFVHTRGGSGGRLSRISAASGDTVDVSARWPSPLPFRTIDISPDGRRVAMTATADGRSDLWVRAIDGSGLQRITDDASAERDPIWMGPDAIAFESNRGGQLDLWQITLSTKRTIQLTSSLMSEVPSAASSDGGLLAFEQAANAINLWQVDLATQATHQLTADTLSDYWPSPSADARRIAFQRARPTSAEGYEFFDARILVAPLQNAASLEPTIIADGFGARLSPEGDWLAYYQRLPVADRLRVVARNLTTGEVRTLSDQAPLPGLAPSQPIDWVEQNMAWQPAGAALNFIAHATAGHEILRAQVTGGREISRLVTSDSRLTDLRVSPDGRAVAYLKRDKENVEVRVRSEAGVDTALTREPAGPTEVLLSGWISADRLLLLRARRTRGAMSSLEMTEASLDGRRRIVATVEDSFLSTARLDPAGRRVFVTRAIAGIHNIHVVNLADGTVKPVTANQAPGTSFSGIQPLGAGAIVFAREERKRDIWIVKRKSP
jgi:Tol biopolymer transport system component